MTKFGDDQNPIIIDLRKEINMQWDFFQFVQNSIVSGHLVAGDTLVVNNACVHTGEDMFEPLTDMLQSQGISIAFLPAYSPELNPCELCFNLMKQALRHYHGTEPLWKEIIKPCTTITREKVDKEYRKCLLFSNISNICVSQINRTYPVTEH